MSRKTRTVQEVGRIILGAVLLTTLTGCGGGTYVWYQQGKDKAAFIRDNLECQEESALYAKHRDKRGNESFIAERMKECMGLRGYVRVREEEVPQGAETF